MNFASRVRAACEAYRSILGKGGFGVTTDPTGAWYAYDVHVCPIGALALHDGAGYRDFESLTGLCHRERWSFIAGWDAISYNPTIHDLEWYLQGSELRKEFLT